MNILWLSHLIPYPPKGGVLQRSYNLMKELSKYHKLYIVCFSQKALHPTDEKRQQALDGLSKICEIAGVFDIKSDQHQWGQHILALKSLFTVDPYTVNWIKNPEVGLRIEKVVKENNIDLVHFDTVSLCTYLNNVSTCKKVLNHHNIESHMMLRRASQEDTYLKKLYYYQEGLKLRHYERKICRHFDLNITCSNADSARLLDDSPGLFVDDIPNGVDLDYFYPLGSKQKKSSLIFAGGMSWYPNVAAIEFFTKNVWPGLIKEQPDTQMTVVGRNPPSWLKDFADREDGFTVTGFVDDVRPYIDSAAVYVCPINDGGGTKLKVLDALAMGKALVAHPIACEGIEVTDGENVLFATTPMEYIDKIQLLFRDEQLRNQLGENGRKLIEEKYSFTSIGKKLSELYSSLV
ncbi:MAG: glycosyltransferase family 4 protein [Gammaproteobacteria bacterium]